LKKAVTDAGRARGVGRSTGITNITVIGDIGSDGELVSPNGTEPSCDLRTETNSFLAELAKGLSEENEGLLQLVRRTTEQLKEMSGWDVASEDPMENGDGHALVLAANPADMSLEVEAVLEHLRTILTNPSFVPIEEVVVREDEIHRLRDGWEKMETRWKEAVHLIDGWRKRMQASGRPVNVEELKMGLRLSPVKVRNVEETSHGYALRLAAVLESEEADLVQRHCDEGPLDLDQELDHDHADSDTSSVFDHDVDVDDLDVEEPNVEILEQSVMLSSPPLQQPPQLSPLRNSDTAGNRCGRPDHRRHPRPFPAIAEEKTRNVVSEEAPLPPPHGERRQQSPQKRPILSLRTVPQEEAAGVALPPSAYVSTPDTSVDSIPFSKAADERLAKALASKTAQRPPPATRKREPVKKEAPKREPPRREAARKKDSETKTTSRPPVKARPPRPPITRGRSDTRPDDKPQTRPPRAVSATSATSAKSTASKATVASKSASASANAEILMPPPPPPHGACPSPAQSPGRSPKRVGVNSRLPLPRPGCNNVLPAPQQSPLSMATITAKLAASEREADAARVRAKLKAARLGKGVSVPPPGTSSTMTEPEVNGGSAATMSTRSETDSVTGSASTAASTSDGAPSSATTRDDDADELGFSPPQKQAQPSPRKEQQQHQQLPPPSESEQNGGGAQADPEKKPTRKRERRTSKTASRRRSTLNSRELDALIQGGKVTVER
jgi:hypothetical protein